MDGVLEKCLWCCFGVWCCFGCEWSRHGGGDQCEDPERQEAGTFHQISCLHLLVSTRAVHSNKICRMGAGWGRRGGVVVHAQAHTIIVKHGGWIWSNVLIQSNAQSLRLAHCTHFLGPRNWSGFFQLSIDISCLFKFSAAYYEQACLSCWHKQEFEAASIKLCIINIHIYAQWYSESSIIYANILSKRFVCDKNVQICTDLTIPQKTIATVTFWFHKFRFASQGNIHIAYFSWRIMAFHFTGLKLHSWLIYKYFYAWNC